MTTTKTKSGHPMRKTKFSIDEDREFEGYTGDSYWNGWDEPCFDQNTAQEVLDHYLNQKCKESADDWRECFQEVLDSEDKIIFSKLTPINLANGETVFEFGFGYCWHEVEEEVK